MAKSIKVLIAEDHEVVREGLKLLISSDPGLEIAGEANTGESAVRLAGKLQPDVVLMDLAMPKGNGLEASKKIGRLAPHAKVLVLSAYQDAETVGQVMAAGVSGYLTKHSAAGELLEAIRKVSGGGSYYSPRLAVRRSARRGNANPARHPAPSPQAGVTPHLTPREQEVVTLIACGQPNKEIAYNLSLSIKTVEKHRQAAMDKLNIHDTAGLTRYAISKGLLAAATGTGAGTSTSTQAEAPAQAPGPGPGPGLEAQTRFWH